jgi:transcriptional regulator with XRE-family HTH domain
MQNVVYIGDRLKDVRVRRALTQAELAENAGVNVATIARLERNETEPHMSTLRKLAKALDVDPTKLVGE